MIQTKEELQQQAQLVRLYEANAGIEHPDDLDLAFRRALMVKLAKGYDFKPPDVPPRTAGPLPPRAPR